MLSRNTHFHPKLTKPKEFKKEIKVNKRENQREYKKTGRRKTTYIYIYHLPLTLYHLTLTTYHLQLTTYHKYALDK